MLLKSTKQNLRNKKDENLFGFHLFFIPFSKVLAKQRLGLEFSFAFVRKCFDVTSDQTKDLKSSFVVSCVDFMIVLDFFFRMQIRCTS